VNFIETFKAWIGPTETPDEFLTWAALSLLAAACGNRITLQYRRGHSLTKLPPNIYCMLVGPSGCGKSFAISKAMEILEKIKEIDGGRRLNVYSGHVTHSGMYEAMRTVKTVTDRKTKQRVVVEMPWKGQLYLLHDELAMCLGDAQYADLIIRALTGMFNGAPFDDYTRTNGHVHLDDYCINWLAGTNVDWLLASVSPNTLNAGFFRRTVIVMGDTAGKRLPPNLVAPRPPGWDVLFPSLVARLDYLLDSEGCFGMTDDAIAIDARWYVNIPAPGRDDHGISVPAGRHDLSLKLALLLTLAKDGTIVDGETLVEAQEMVEQAVRWQDEIIPMIRKGVVGAPHDRILQFILGRDGWISKAKIAKYAYEKCAVDAKKLQEMLKTWLEAGILLDQRRNGTTYYREVR